MSQLLERLFGAPARLKLLKLFLMNPEARFRLEQILRSSKLAKGKLEGLLKEFGRLGVIQSELRKIISAGPEQLKKSRKAKAKARVIRERVFYANAAFPFFPELRALILKSIPYARGELIAKLRGMGSVKLAILGGVFANDPNARVDVFLVCDKVRKPRLASILKWLEVLVGRELNYVLMSSQEFRYRRDLFDHFLREVLEAPHEKVINRLGV